MRFKDGLYARFQGSSRWIAFRSLIQLFPGQPVCGGAFVFIAVLSDPSVNVVFADAKAASDFGTAVTLFNHKANSISFEFFGETSSGFSSIHGTPRFLYFRSQKSVRFL
jgi:hypothetical protein